MSTAANRQINIYVNSGDAEKAFERLTNQNTKLTKSVSKNQEELTKLEKEMASFNGAKSSKEFKELKNAVDLKRAAVEKDTTTMKLNNQEMDRIQKKIKGELSPSLSDLRKRLSQVTAEFNKMSKEDGGFDEKKKELLELQKQLNEHNASIGKTNNAYKTLSEGSSDFMDRMRDFRDGNFAAAFDGLGESMKGMLASMRAFILSPIGATITLLAGLALATKEWLSYNNEIAKQNALIEQLTGSSGEMTDSYREMATAVEDVFGKDFKETVLELDNLVKDFGISADEAFKIYTDGMVRGGASNSEFGESIREYGQLFANNGYSAQEFINILNAGIDLQIYNDKLPDAIKEAGLSLTEQTKATKDAMVNAFGAQFTDEILSKVKSGEMTVAQALTNISAKAKDANLNQQQLAQLTADMFRGAGEDAGGALMIFNALNRSVNMSTEELTKYQEALNKAVSKSRELEKAQTDALSSNMVMSIKQNFETQWKEAQIYFYKLISEIRGIGNNIGAFWASQSFAVKNIPKVWLGAFQDIKVYFFNLINFLKSGKDIIKDILTGNVSGVKSGLSNLSNFDISKGAGNYTKALEASRIKQKQVFDEYMQQKDIQMQAEAELFRSKQEKETVSGKTSNTPTGKLRQSQANRFKPSFSNGPNQSAESTFLLGNHLTPEQLNEKIAEYNVFLDALKKRQEDFNLFQKQNRANNTQDINDDYAVQLESIDLKYNREIEAAKGNAELIKQIEAEKNEALLQAGIEHNTNVKAQDDLTWQNKMERIAGYVAMGNQLLQGFMAVSSNDYNADLNREQRANEKKKQEYKRMLDSKRISQYKYNDLVEKADEESAKKQNEIKRKQFESDKQQKRMAIIGDTAAAIMRAAASAPFPANLIPIGFATIQGGLQLAAVDKTKFQEMKYGGILNGPSHDQGGLKVYNPQTGMIEAELEGGESHIVMSKPFTEANADIIPSILAASRKGTRLYDELPAFNTVIPRINTSRALDSIRFANGGVIPATTSPPTTSQITNGTNTSKSIEPISILNDNLVQLIGSIDSKVFPLNYELLAKNVAEYFKKYGVIK